MFKQTFIDLCNKKGVAPSAVCRDIGLSNATYSCWTDESVPRRATLQRISDYFGVTVDYLLGNETEQKKPPADIGEELSEGQRKLIEFARSVPEDKIDLVLKVMQSIVEAD